MQKWEYCGLNDQIIDNSVYMVSFYANGDGTTILRRLNGKGGIGIAFAQLGMEGWEVTGVVHDMEEMGQLIFFKRPLCESEMTTSVRLGTRDKLTTAYS